MILQAYIDDSRDDESGTYVLAGYIASVEQWAAFSQEWEGILPLAVKNKSGNFRFKMSEMARCGKMNAVPIFYNTIMKHVDMSVSCVINVKSLRNEVDNLVASITNPAFGEINIDIESYKQKWRDPFFFAFRALMDGFHKMRIGRPDLVPLNDVVSFYFDTDSNETFIRSIWDGYLEHRSPEYRQTYGEKPEFKDDEKFLAIQAADFRAWWVRKWAKELGPKRVSEGTYPFGGSDRKIFHLVITVDEELISRSVADAIGEAIQETTRRGVPISVTPNPSTRFWPRPPL